MLRNKFRVPYLSYLSYLVGSHVGARMSTWLVRVSNFPFTLPGKKLGTVEARTKADAITAAEQCFAGPFVVELEPSVNSTALERAVAAIERRTAHQARRRRGEYRRGGEG